MKRKVQTGLCIIAGIAISIAVLWTVVFYIRGGEIKKDIFNQFSYVVFEDHVELMKYYGNKKEVKLPDKIWGRPITIISSNCFRENKTIQKLSLPEPLEVIEEKAFYKCYGLQEIQGGEKVHFIESSAFLGCESLYDIGALGKSVRKIGEGAFAYCSRLTYVPFTENLTQIYGGAFRKTGIVSVDKVGNVEYIGSDAFTETPWLEQQKEDFVIYNDILIRYQGEDRKVIIPDGIKGISVKFNEIPEIQEIYIPSTAKYILSNSLIFCNNVRIYIPREVEKIGYEYTFEGEELIKRLDNLEVDKGNVIVTTTGSPAEAYAKEFGYQCEIVEGW